MTRRPATSPGAGAARHTGSEWLSRRTRRAGPTAWSTLGLLTVSYGLIVGVVALDWLTPPGVAVAILLSIPFMLLSLLDDVRQLWIAGAVALTGRFADMLLGGVPTIPREIWLPNRVLITIGIIGSVAVAQVLIRQRTLARRARDAALNARDMNRLLASLMAHDLRTPLVVANDALTYAERAAIHDLPIDTTLLVDARSRLRRSLRTVESVLTVARAEVAPHTGHVGQPLASSVEEVVVRELEFFTADATQRGKPIVTQFSVPAPDSYVFDALVVRQALAILVDNAVRYADPGSIRVETAVIDRDLVIRVADHGPGLRTPAGSRCTERRHGAGVGLELCRLLVSHSGGRMELESDGPTETCFVLRLPVRSAVSADQLAQTAEAAQGAPQLCRA